MKVSKTPRQHSAMESAHRRLQIIAPSSAGKFDRVVRHGLRAESLFRTQARVSGRRENTDVRLGRHARLQLGPPYSEIEERLRHGQEEQGCFMGVLCFWEHSVARTGREVLTALWICGFESTGKGHEG